MAAQRAAAAMPGMCGWVGGGGEAAGTGLDASKGVGAAGSLLDTRLTPVFHREARGPGESG